jgi:transcription antitermination factor NusG
MNSEDNDLRWFALVVRTRWERSAAFALARRGSESLLPVFKQRRRWSDRWKELELPLFPGYLFCRFDPENRLPVLTTPGVLSIVGRGKVPIPIKPEEIAAIQLLVQSGLPARPWPFLEAGQAVQVNRGPLRGLKGIVLQLKSETKLVLSVTLLKRSVAVEMNRNWISSEPLSGSCHTDYPEMSIIGFGRQPAAPDFGSVAP